MQTLNYFFDRDVYMTSAIFQSLDTRILSRVTILKIYTPLPTISPDDVILGWSLDFCEFTKFVSIFPSYSMSYYTWHCRIRSWQRRNDTVGISARKRPGAYDCNPHWKVLTSTLKSNGHSAIKIMRLFFSRKGTFIRDVCVSCIFSRFCGPAKNRRYLLNIFFSRFFTVSFKSE